MPQTIFTAEVNDFCQKFAVIRTGRPEPTQTEVDAASSSVRKSLFENLLLFDKLSLKITNESIPVPFLIGVLGQKGFDALLEQNAFEFIIWAQRAGTMVQNIPGLDGLVAIGQPPELLDPEKSIDAGLQWMPTAPPPGRPRRRFIRRLLPYFRVTDKEIGLGSLNVVRTAMKAGGLEHYGLPKVTALHADNMSASEKTIAAQCADQFAEYKYILDHGMTSFANYKYYSPFWDSASRFQTMNRSVEGFSRIATLDGLPDLKALFDQIPAPFAKLPHLRQTRNARFFRNWLEKTAGESPDVDMVKSYLDALAERTGVLDTKRGRILKTVGMATVGMAAGGAATHLAGAEAGFAAGTVAAFVTDKLAEFTTETVMGLLDSFVLEGVSKGRTPRMFLDDLSQLRAPAAEVKVS
jgi:hypothetical protein